MTYTVTYSIDHLDPNPSTITFDTFDEAQDWLHDEVDRRVSFVVQHAPHTLTEKEMDELIECEYSLVTLKQDEPPKSTDLPELDAFFR